MQPDWDDSIADQGDEDESIRGDVGTQQIQVSIEDILNSKHFCSYLAHVRIALSRVCNAAVGRITIL